MKLKNKVTGEINIVKIDEDYFNIYKDDGEFVCPVTLKELNAGWKEYYEKPKGYWWISPLVTDVVYCTEDVNDEMDKYNKEIGNYFKDKESAYATLEKLKAIKRLKDKGAKIIDYECYGGTNTKGEFSGEVKITIDMPQEVDKYLFKLLFGIEEFKEEK